MPRWAIQLNSFLQPAALAVVLIALGVAVLVKFPDLAATLNALLTVFSLLCVGSGLTSLHFAAERVLALVSLAGDKLQ